MTGKIENRILAINFNKGLSQEDIYEKLMFLHSERVDVVDMTSSSTVEKFVVDGLYEELPRRYIFIIVFPYANMDSVHSDEAMRLGSVLAYSAMSVPTIMFIPEHGNHFIISEVNMLGVGCTDNMQNVKAFISESLKNTAKHFGDPEFVRKQSELARKYLK